jgi:hypothetical protein
LSQLDKAIVEASRMLRNAIANDEPEADTKSLPRKIKELVASTISTQSSSQVLVTASHTPPRINVAADGLACAHAMYVAGDKVNALRMAIFAFESPDCPELITAFSELNEEIDPSDEDSLEVISRFNKGMLDNADVADPSFAEEGDIDPDSFIFSESNDVENDDHPAYTTPPEASSVGGQGYSDPGSLIDQILNNISTDPMDNTVNVMDTAQIDHLNQGTPPNSRTVMQNVMSDAPVQPDDLGDEDYGFNGDMADAGYSDNFDAVPADGGGGDISNTGLDNDPATSVEWNPANWDIDDDQMTRSDPTDMDFDDMGAVNPGMTDLNGINNTVQGDPKNESDIAGLDSQFGLIPSLVPDRTIIARAVSKIKDPVVIAAINMLSSKDDEKSVRKLNAFINLYCQRHGIA